MGDPRHFGTVTAVNTTGLGGVLTADHPAGVSALTVEDAADFSEDGGQLLLAGQVIDYTTADDDTGTITLAAPLAVAAAEGDRVDVYDPERGAAAVETIAQVAAEGADFSDDNLEAEVDHALIGYLPDGIRTSEGELVELTERGDTLYVTNVMAAQPLLDGTFIDPATMPSAGPDGLPPATSPTPTVRGGIGTLFVQWTPVDNADPVTYEVHASAASGFTPSSATLAAETAGSLAVLRTLPTGSPLVNGTTYYVRVVAKDADGAAAAGVQASAAPVQATSADIAVNAVTADQVAANAITAAELAAQAVTATHFQGQTIDASQVTIRTGTTGSRLVIDATGLDLFNAAGEQTVDLDAATGNALVSGEYRSAYSGPRVRIAPAQGLIQIFSGRADESNASWVWTRTDPGLAHTLEIRSPIQPLGVPTRVILLAPGAAGGEQSLVLSVPDASRVEQFYYFRSDRITLPSGREIHDTGWTPHTTVAAAGWSIAGVDAHCETRVVDGICYLDVDAERTGGSLTSGTNANLADQTVLTLPAGRRPDRQTNIHFTVGNFTHGTGVVETSGALVLQTMHTNTSIGTGNRVHVTVSYPLP